MGHASSKTGFSNMKKTFPHQRLAAKARIVLKSMLQKAPKSFFWSIAGIL
jgi:hypothetical protein